MGDTTKRESKDHKKVHASFIAMGIATTSVIEAVTLGAKAEDLHLPYVESMPDLMPLENGTTEELERVMCKEFVCASTPQLNDRANQNCERRLSGGKLTHNPPQFPLCLLPFAPVDPPISLIPAHAKSSS